jgi:hypothetical protein
MRTNTKKVRDKTIYLQPTLSQTSALIEYYVHKKGISFNKRASIYAKAIEDFILILKANSLIEGKNLYMLDDVLLGEDREVLNDTKIIDIIQMTEDLKNM